MVSVMNDAGDANPQLPVMQIPTKEHTSNMQVHTILAIMGHLQPYLLLTHREIEEELRPFDIDGGAKSSAEVTFVNACARLDAILKEEERWSGKPQKDLMESTIKTQQSLIAVHEAQLKALSIASGPAKLYPPTFTTANGQYYAFHGSADFPGGIIIGKGNTPLEAVADFEAAFSKIPSEQLRFNDRAINRISQVQNGQANVTSASETEPAPAPERPSLFRRIVALFRRRSNPTS